METIDSTVVKIEPLLRKLSDEQANANRKAKAQKKPEPFEKQAYLLVTLAGDVFVYVWDKHLFRAVGASGGKHVIWKVERGTTAGVTAKEFLRLAEIVSQDGVGFVVDPESKDWIPVNSIKTQAPAVPDSGETAPVDKSIDPQGNTIIEGTESLWQD